MKWYPSWRQYCYFPTIKAVYSKGCLDDIGDFIKQISVQRNDKPGRKTGYAGETPAVASREQHVPVEPV